mgnify:CR=1 FL=1
MPRALSGSDNLEHTCALEPYGGSLFRERGAQLLECRFKDEAGGQARSRCRLNPIVLGGAERLERAYAAPLLITGIGITVNI